MKKMQAKSRTGTFREGRGEFVGDLSPGLDMLPCKLLLPASSHSITNGSNIIGSMQSLACAPRIALKGLTCPLPCLPLLPPLPCLSLYSSIKPAAPPTDPEIRLPSPCDLT